MSYKKIVDLNALEVFVTQQRSLGKTFALANGGFDLLHVGHIRYLSAAKETANFLVVAVNSDRALKLLKGEHRAVIDEQGRLRMIAALECVDYVLLVDALRMDEVILQLKPNFHCKGSDYTPETVPERETARAIGATVMIVGGPKIRSSSQVLSQIKSQEIG